MARRTWLPCVGNTLLGQEVKPSGVWYIHGMHMTGTLRSLFHAVCGMSRAGVRIFTRLPTFSGTNVDVFGSDCIYGDQLRLSGQRHGPAACRITTSISTSITTSMTVFFVPVPSLHGGAIQIGGGTIVSSGFVFRP